MTGKLLVWAIVFYQKRISPLLPSVCRFTPTCSCYGKEAIEKHGTVTGLVLTGWRIIRCNPLSKTRLDPVPEKGRALDAFRRRDKCGCKQASGDA